MPTPALFRSSDKTSRRVNKLAREAWMLFLGLSAPACGRWRTEVVTPAQAVAEGQPERVRITEPSGEKLVVLRPTVAGDTLRGRSASGDYAIAVPLADVLRLETRQGNRVASGVVAAVLGAGLVAIVACSAANC